MERIQSKCWGEVERGSHLRYEEQEEEEEVEHERCGIHLQRRRGARHTVGGGMARIAPQCGRAAVLEIAFQLL